MVKLLELNTITCLNRYQLIFKSFILYFQNFKTYFKRAMDLTLPLKNAPLLMIVYLPIHNVRGLLSMTNKGEIIHKRIMWFQKLTRNLFLTLHGHNVHLVMLFLHGASFLNRARNSRCTVITDLDTSKRSTQKAFPCCDAILEIGPAAPQ